MAQLTAGFETGTNGSNILTSDSGNATAWDLSVDPGATLKYSNTRAHDGSLSALLDNTGFTASNCLLEWNTAYGTQTEHYGRIYIYVASLPSGLWRGIVGNSEFADFMLSISSDGKLRIDDNTGVTNGTVAIATNQWVRIEWHVVHNISTGSFEVRLYNTADSNTADDTIIASSRNTGANSTLIWFGVISGTGFAWQVYMDRIVANAATWPGPIGGSPPSTDRLVARYVRSGPF